MAIQFACPACRQPIEVDDEHGGRQVSCPYCRNVVAAPTESEPDLISRGTAGQTPDARPMQSPAGETGAPPIPPGSTGQAPTPVRAGETYPPWQGSEFPPIGMPSAAPRKNIVGVVGLISGLVAMGLSFAAVTILLPHAEELGAAPGQKVNQAEMQERLRQMTNHLDQHAWLARVLTYFAGSLFCWLAGIVCSAIGLSKRYRNHGVAIAGLIVAFVLPALTCAGFAAG